MGGWWFSAWFFGFHSSLFLSIVIFFFCPCLALLMEDCLYTMLSFLLSDDETASQYLQSTVSRMMMHTFFWTIPPSLSKFPPSRAILYSPANLYFLDPRTVIRLTNITRSSVHPTYQRLSSHLHQQIDLSLSRLTKTLGSPSKQPRPQYDVCMNEFSLSVINRGSTREQRTHNSCIPDYHRVESVIDKRVRHA